MPVDVPPASDPASWPTGRLLATAARLLEHAWVEALQRLDLTHAGLIVLHLLDGGGHSQSELATLARVERQTMSRTIERLQSAGYVTRVSDTRDRRRNLVQRTDGGARVWAQVRELEREVFPAVAGETALRGTLLELIAALTGDARAHR